MKVAKVLIGKGKILQKGVFPPMKEKIFFLTHTQNGKRTPKLIHEIFNENDQKIIEKLDISLKRSIVLRILHAQPHRKTRNSCKMKIKLKGRRKNQAVVLKVCA